MIFASRDIPGQFSRFDFPPWLPAPWCVPPQYLAAQKGLVIRGLFLSCHVVRLFMVLSCH